MYVQRQAAHTQNLRNYMESTLSTTPRKSLSLIKINQSDLTAHECSQLHNRSRSTRHTRYKTKYDTIMYMHSKGDKKANLSLAHSTETFPARNLTIKFGTNTTTVHHVPFSLSWSPTDTQTNASKNILPHFCEDNHHKTIVPNLSCTIYCNLFTLSFSRSQDCLESRVVLLLTSLMVGAYKFELNEEKLLTSCDHHKTFLKVHRNVYKIQGN